LQGLLCKVPGTLQETRPNRRFKAIHAQNRDMKEERQGSPLNSKLIRIQPWFPSHPIHPCSHSSSFLILAILFILSLSIVTPEKWR